MQISARNQLEGTISHIECGEVNSEIEITLKGGEKIYSVITKESKTSLKLEIGCIVIAFFKASSVILIDGDDFKVSARNQLRGEVVKAQVGIVSAEVVLELRGGERISASITKDALNELTPKIGSNLVALIKASSVIIAIKEI